MPKPYLSLQLLNYSQTIEYLFSKLPMFSRIGAAAFKKDLTNTISLCEYLDNPQQKFKSIHVAGTNGKGSVSHMMAAILQTAGYKTGLYTSPHLRDFRERIKVNGEMISAEFVVGFTEKIAGQIESIQPSFFEITVAMAFDYFKQQQVDVAVIETGLGGRLDSTNVITPELSIITNIGWDHMDLLGDSLEKIAFEKAGIIKPSVPVVVGEASPETDHVFRQVANEKDAPLSVASEQRQAIGWHWDKHELVVEVTEPHRVDHQVYHLDLPGIYQAKNLVTVLEACARLNERAWTLGEDQIKKGLRQTKKLTDLHGRWEIIHQHPTVVLDVAHNEDGIRMLMEQVELTDHDHLHIIFGVVKDKETDRVLSLLPRLAEYYFTQARIPRALDRESLQQRAAGYGLHGKIYEDVNRALQAALTTAYTDDLILICGSVFLVGEVDLA